MTPTPKELRALAERLRNDTSGGFGETDADLLDQLAAQQESTGAVNERDSEVYRWVIKHHDFLTDLQETGLLMAAAKDRFVIRQHYLHPDSKVAALKEEVARLRAEKEALQKELEKVKRFINTAFAAAIAAGKENGK